MCSTEGCVETTSVVDTHAVASRVRIMHPAWNVYCMWHIRVAEEQTRERQNDRWKDFMRRVIFEYLRGYQLQYP